MYVINCMYVHFIFRITIIYIYIIYIVPLGLFQRLLVRIYEKRTFSCWRYIVTTCSFTPFTPLLLAPQRHLEVGKHSFRADGRILQDTHASQWGKMWCTHLFFQHLEVVGGIFFCRMDGWMDGWWIWFLLWTCICFWGQKAKRKFCVICLQYRYIICISFTLEKALKWVILVGALRDVIHEYLVKLLAGTGKVCLVQVILFVFRLGIWLLGVL